MLDYLPILVPEKYKEEMWFPITTAFFPTIAPGYMISTWGRIHNVYTGQLIPNEFYSEKNDYIGTYLHTTEGPAIEWPLHRIMMYIFKNEEYSDELQVNHKDGKKYHNWIWNLEMATGSENLYHAHNTGLAGKGETSYQSTITDNQAKAIASMVVMDIPLGMIEKSLRSIMPNVDIYSIAQTMKRGLAWNDIVVQMKGELTERNKVNKFSEEQIREICQVLETRGINTSTEEILAAIGLNPREYTEAEMRAFTKRMSRIRTRTAYAHISCNYNF